MKFVKGDAIATWRSSHSSRTTSSPPSAAPSGRAPPAALLLTGAEIRRYVRRLIETEHPDLPVLSFQELAPEAQIRPIARISV
jgi:type III secretion protein V